MLKTFPPGLFQRCKPKMRFFGLLKKSIHYGAMIDFARPALGSGGLFFNCQP
jgi:hypothetical protein